MAKATTVFVVGRYVNRDRDGSAEAQAHGYLDYLTLESEAVPEGGELGAFTRDGQTLSREAAHDRMDGWEHKYFHFVESLSPHPERYNVADWSPANWREWTESAMWALEERHPDLQWLAVQHPDREHPHVQLILASETTLRRDELGLVREAGDLAAELLSERQRGLEEDPMLALYAEVSEPAPSMGTQAQTGQTMAQAESLHAANDPGQGAEPE